MTAEQEEIFRKKEEKYFSDTSDLTPRRFSARDIFAVSGIHCSTSATCAQNVFSRPPPAQLTDATNTTINAIQWTELLKSLVPEQGKIDRQQSIPTSLLSGKKSEAQEMQSRDFLPKPVPLTNQQHQQLIKTGGHYFAPFNGIEKHR